MLKFITMKSRNLKDNSHKDFCFLVAPVTLNEGKDYSTVLLMCSCIDNRTKSKRNLLKNVKMHESLDTIRRAVVSFPLDLMIFTLKHIAMNYN